MKSIDIIIAMEFLYALIDDEFPKLVIYLN